MTSPTAIYSQSDPVPGPPGERRGSLSPTPSGARWDRVQTPFLSPIMYTPEPSHTPQLPGEVGVSPLPHAMEAGGNQLTDHTDYANNKPLHPTPLRQHGMGRAMLGRFREGGGSPPMGAATFLGSHISNSSV